MVPVFFGQSGRLHLYLKLYNIMRYGKRGDQKELKGNMHNAKQ